MAKGRRRSLSEAQVEVRRARNERRSVARDRREVLETLGQARGELEALRAAEWHWLASRDAAVVLGREVGLSWGEMASAAGTTRQALMRRVGGADEDGGYADEG